MSNLVAVSLRRMFRTPVFIIFLIITVLFCAYFVNVNARTQAEWAAEGEDYVLEDSYYELAPLLGLPFAAFVSLFLGVEYSDGTLRSKLIAGHSRSSVFISFFLTSAFGCIIMTLAWLLVNLLGLQYFDGFSFGMKMYFLYALLAILCACAYAAIYTVISMLTPNKAVSAVVCLILWFVMLFAGSSLVNMLQASPTTQTYIQQGTMWVASGEEIPNPNYVSGATRVFCELLCHINPAAVGIEMATVDIVNPLAEIAYSAAETVMLLVAGCAVFKRKDLK